MPHAEQPRSELSQRGVLVLSIAVVTFLYGMARADGVLACVCLLVLLSFPLAKWRGRLNLLGLALRGQGAHRAIVGQQWPLRISLERRAALFVSRDIGIRLRAPGGAEVHCGFSSIESGTTSCADLSMEMKQRGEISSFGYEIQSAYPLGLWVHGSAGQLEQPLIVTPRPVVSKKLALTGWWREGLADWGASHATHAGEIRGLRAWRPGDSFKRVHPAASARSYARGQGLMVAETDPPGFAPRHVTVMFHSYAADRAIIRPEMFERALSYLGGTLLYLCHQSLPATCVADFDGWLEQSCRNRRELRDLLDHLSRVKRQADTEWHELQRVQSKLDPQTSLIVISDMPFFHWQSAIMNREIPTIIVPVHSGESGRHFHKNKR